MFNSKLGILGAVAVLSLVGFAIWQRQSQVRFREEHAVRQQQVAQLSELTEEFRRFSNVVWQARIAQASANEQADELRLLRTEVNRLRQAQELTNQMSYAALAQSASNQVRELVALRSELGDLGDELSDLRDSVQDLQAAVVTPPVETRAAQPARSPVALRMIDVHAETFAEKLKRSAAAQESETFQEVFSRFLRAGGADLSNVAGLGFDERVGRVIVRAPQPDLDAIERLTLSLDRQ